MRAFRSFIRERSLDILILYLALQLIVIGASGWLNRTWLVIIGTVILGGAVAWLVFVERRRAKSVPDLGKEEAFQKKRKAVVFTVGLRPYSKSICPIVLAHLDVQIVGLLATPKVMIEQYDAYRSALEHEGLVVEPTTWDNEDFADIVTKTEALLKKLVDNHHLAPADIVVDVTGGTVLMSLGAFFAAEKHKVECQVIASQYEKDGTIIPGTVRPILVVSHGQIAG